MTDEAVARILKYAAKEVGVSPSVRVSPHTCRHTFAQMQLKNGLDLYSVSRLMGHVSIMITQRYLLGIKDKDIVDRGTQTSPLMNLEKLNRTLQEWPRRVVGLLFLVMMYKIHENHAENSNGILLIKTEYCGIISFP